VQKSKSRLLGLAQTSVILKRSFEKIACSNNICLNECCGRIDRTVDMRFGGKVDDADRPIPTQELIDQPAIDDVPMHECMFGTIAWGNGIQVASVGQQIEIDDAITT
jgi:hypothetical protein